MLRTLPKEKKLKRLFNNKLFRNVERVVVTDILDITAFTGRNIKATKLYRVAHAHIAHAGNQPFTIVDKDFRLQPSLTEVCLLIYSDYRKLQNSSEWTNEAIGRICKAVSQINVKNFFELFDNVVGVTWKQLIDYFVDHTGFMDERLLNVFKGSYLHLPFEESAQHWQRVNNHSFVVTNTRIGKTAGYYNMTGETPSTAYTEAGLIGTNDRVNTEQQIQGRLNGNGMYAFDEFPRHADQSQHAIIDKIYSYMTNGETNRDIAGGVTCVGTKSLLFFGNVPNEYNSKSFFMMLKKLAGEGAGIDACGSRIAHILFGTDFVTLNSDTTNVDKYTDRLRWLIEVLMFEKRKIIEAILKKMFDWIIADDLEYKKAILDLIPLAPYDDIQNFLKGHVAGCSRLKMAAVKQAILENLDIICMKTYTEAMPTIQKDAEDNYKRFKEYNIRSLDFLHDTRKSAVLELVKQGKKYNDIVAAGINIYETTYYKYIKEWREKGVIKDEENKTILSEQTVNTESKNVQQKITQ